MNKSCNWLADPCHQIVGPDITEGYAIGETDFERWGRLWKACASDPELDGEEWVIFLERIQEHFRRNYENFPDEFYFWGDFSGDRTLDLKIAKLRVLTARLLSDLQEYLQMNGQKMWRIRIPIYFQPNDPRRVVVVYPHAIDIPSILPSRIRSSSDHCADNDALWRRGCRSSSSEELKPGQRLRNFRLKNTNQEFPSPDQGPTVFPSQQCRRVKGSIDSKRHIRPIVRPFGRN
jgi:hypothetical protein